MRTSRDRSRVAAQIPTLGTFRRASPSRGSGIGISRTSICFGIYNVYGFTYAVNTPIFSVSRAFVSDDCVPRAMRGDVVYKGDPSIVSSIRERNQGPSEEWRGYFFLEYPHLGIVLQERPGALRFQVFGVSPSSHSGPFCSSGTTASEQIVPYASVPLEIPSGPLPGPTHIAVERTGNRLEHELAAFRSKQRFHGRLRRSPLEKARTYSLSAS